MFEIFNTFQIEIYYSIIISILVLSLVIGVSKLSVKFFFSTIWSYISVILSHFDSLKIESTVDRLLTGIWLLSCITLMAAFSGILKDLLITSLPIFSIDTLDNLMDRENIRIDTFVKTGFIEYIEKIDRYKHSKLKNIIINYY